VTENTGAMFQRMFKPAPWMERAACRGADPALFHPSRGEDTRPAQRICASCPVRDECLEYAVANEERQGIWGGLSQRQRTMLIRKPRGGGFDVPREVSPLPSLARGPRPKHVDSPEGVRAHEEAKKRCPVGKASRTGYVKGCRCQDCTDANTAYIDRWRSDDT
jgi:WhiB family redox-sensing transcriptional regulator